MPLYIPIFLHSIKKETISDEMLLWKTIYVQWIIKINESINEWSGYLITPLGLTPLCNNPKLWTESKIYQK